MDEKNSLNPHTFSAEMEALLPSMGIGPTTEQLKKMELELEARKKALYPPIGGTMIWHNPSDYQNIYEQDWFTKQSLGAEGAVLTWQDLIEAKEKLSTYSALLFSSSINVVPINCPHCSKPLALKRNVIMRESVIEHANSKFVIKDIELSGLDYNTEDTVDAIHMWLRSIHGSA